PRSCRCSSVTYSSCPRFFSQTTNKVMSAIPATNVEANVYQLYMVLYQCESILINHNQGSVEPTESANTTVKSEAHTVLSQIHFLEVSKSILPRSVCKLRLRIFLPSNHHKPTVTIENTEKNTGLRNPFLPNKIGSCATA